MDTPELDIKVGGKPLTLTYDNSEVRLFTDAPGLDYLHYEDGDTAHAIFECRELLSTLLELGFPLSVRNLPAKRDEEAVSGYTHHLAENLDEEIDQLEGGEP